MGIASPTYMTLWANVPEAQIFHHTTLCPERKHSRRKSKTCNPRAALLLYHFLPNANQLKSRT